MDRAIFKSHQIHYFFSFYLHLNKRKNYSSAVLPLSVVARMSKFDFGDDGLDGNLARSTEHLHFSSLINVIEEQRRGEQNVCRKPEVAYPTVPPPTLAFHKPPTLFKKKSTTKKRKQKGSAVTSQTLLPDWLAWVRTVCEKNFGYRVRWLQSCCVVRGSAIDTLQ